MYKAELRCTKCPIICTNQTGRSNLYCNGAIECEYQRATIEWDGLAAQKNEEAPETIDNNDRDAIFRIRHIVDNSHSFSRQQILLVLQDIIETAPVS